MDHNQVRARIVEVAQLVKKTLPKANLCAENEEQDCLDSAAGAKPRRGSFWIKDRGYKYVDDLDYHLRRLSRAFEFLNPVEGSSIFEIGPGNGFFLFMCRELRGCQVAGVDWKHDGVSDPRDAREKPFRGLAQYAHSLFRQHFGLENVIRHQIVAGHKPVDFNGQYNAIVATHTAFNKDWREEEYRFWLEDCFQHLQPEGRLMIALNKVNPEVLAALPFLRPPQPTRGFKKLTIVAREIIGQTLMDKK